MLVKKQKQSDSFTPLSRLRLKSKRFYLKGFTVLELLIVIAIVGIITSVLLVAFKGAMERARIAQGWQFSDSLRGALQMDMVAWWPLDRIVDGKTPDSWFDRNDGTVYGNTKVVEGIVNNALEFDGDGDYVLVPNSSATEAPAATDQITVETWVLMRTAEYTSNMTHIISYMPTYGIRCGDKDKTVDWQGFSMSVRGAGAGTQAHIATETIPEVNRWYHVVGTYDGTTLAIYLDGQLVNSTITTDGIEPNTNNLYIGQFKDGGYNHNGLIDEVRIYNAALPSAAIQQHYSEGLKRHQDFAIR